MARRALSVSPLGRVGAALAVLICGLYLVAGLAVGVRAPSDSIARLTDGDWAALRFTVLQAVVSAGVSVALAVPVARALARRRFIGRGLLIALLGAPFVLPVIVAVLGLLSVFGRGGLINDALALVGMGPWSIYGLQGVVIGHVFFNLPLAVRFLLAGWQAIPAERFRLTEGLGGSVWHLLERPMLREVAPSAFAAIFLICLSSFAVALTLGGGPSATTIEVAIYQALRFEFDLQKAAVLAALQAALGIGGALVALRLSVGMVQGAGLDRPVLRQSGRVAGFVDGVVILAAAAFLVLPLGMVAAKGVAGLGDLPDGLPAAAIRSLCIALSVAVATPALALAIAARGGAAQGVAMALPLSVSGLVMGTGLFIAINPVIDPAVLALPVTALMNCLIALPFAIRVVAPALARAEQAYGPLADGLGLHGVARVRVLYLPRMRRALGFSAGLAGAMAVGDLGVIVLFAGQSQETLPLLMYRLMGAYRTTDAAAVALVLLVMSLSVFWVFDRGGRADAASG